MSPIAEARTYICIDLNLCAISQRLDSRTGTGITYFQRAQKKNGGAYITVTDAAKRIDEYENTVVLSSGNKLPVEDIIDIDDGSDTDK